IDWFDGKD
nr:Chain C, 8-meric Peptide P8d [Gallus gallus]4G42_F Chain F, 8-meric Peptide P8d [Gallus gallus]